MRQPELSEAFDSCQRILDQHAASTCLCGHKAVDHEAVVYYRSPDEPIGSTLVLAGPCRICFTKCLGFQGYTVGIDFASGQDYTMVTHYSGNRTMSHTVDADCADCDASRPNLTKKIQTLRMALIEILNQTSLVDIRDKAVVALNRTVS